MKFSDSPSADRITVYRDSSKQWRWRQKARNGEIVATSGEGYTTRWGARRAARRNFPGATIDVLPPDA